MGTHDVAHEYHKKYGNCEKSPAFPDSDDQTDSKMMVPEERNNPANRCHVGDSLAQIRLVVFYSSQRKNESNVEDNCSVCPKSKEKEVEE